MPNGSTGPTANLWSLDMSNGERMLIGTIRRWANNRQCWPLVKKDFRDACGDDGEWLLIAVTQFLVTVVLYGRRPLVLGLTGLGGVTRDELQLLNLFAVAQTGDDATLHARLCRLLACPAISSIPAFLTRIAHILAVHGHTIPVRPVPPATENAHARPATASVH